ncbi:MAG: DUF1080 domain-containing protein, partial [Candidatus Moduliflexus flocculans]|nr:DUF1080 domain-containing protein [Candidatus Moduliflexus flocculans]
MRPVRLRIAGQHQRHRQLLQHLLASKPAGEWNHLRIEFRGPRLKVVLNGRTALDWESHPGGKVRDLAPEGYIGLQNHDSQSPPYFRNVFLKEL